MQDDASNKKVSLRLMRLRRAARHAESIGIHPRETCAAQGDLGLHKPLMVCLCEVLQLGIGLKTFENTSILFLNMFGTC